MFGHVYEVPFNTAHLFRKQNKKKLLAQPPRRTKTQETEEEEAAKIGKVIYIPSDCEGAAILGSFRRRRSMVLAAEEGEKGYEISKGQKMEYWKGIMDKGPSNDHIEGLGWGVPEWGGAERLRTNELSE